MAQDFAKQRKTTKPRKKSQAQKKKSPPAKDTGSTSTQPLRWFGAGLFTGVLLSFLMYLGTLPANSSMNNSGDATTAANETKQPPKPRFDFYTVLPERTIDVEVDPKEIATARSTSKASVYLLQAGSFKQREDADRRRAELILLGLEPKIEETTGDNGRWFRVYIGPFDSKSRMAKARSLTANQDIDTLLLKRNSP